MSRDLNDDDIMPIGQFKGKRLGDVPEWWWISFLKAPFCDKYPDLVTYGNNCVEDDD